MTRITSPLSTNVFNARDMKSLDVAKRFIAPSVFPSLLGDYNCVLEGPRGSGKTTLLRMLTPDAFSKWEKNQGARIDFVGVFVPADVRWAKQLTSRLGGLDGKSKDLLMQSAFSVATSLSLIETIECCSSQSEEFKNSYPEIFFTLEREMEAKIVRSLSKVWKINVDVPSFEGIKLSLRVRQHDIGHISTLLICGGKLSDVVAENQFISSSWLDNLSSAISIINEMLGRLDQRWAILLDELEIVPSEILNSIVQALRSTSPQIKFKLALSPTGTDLIMSGDSTAPTPGNDYRPIPLWYEHREDARMFSERLLLEELLRSGLSTTLDLGEVLGVNWIGGSSDDEDLSATPITVNVRRDRIAAFERLYRKDESFRDILDKKGIIPSNPQLSDKSPSGTFVRKITPLVCMREREIESYTYSHGSIKKGGRKSTDAYVGYPNLIDLTEGNPRWVLTLVDLLQSRSRLQEQKIGSKGVQSGSLSDYVDQFVSKLTVYPTGQSGGRNWTLMKFVDELGATLNQALYDSKFDGDPALSFTIDAKALSQYEDYIRLCIDLGALVFLKRGSVAPLAQSRGSSSLLGARVRISYRLAPRFRLPLRSTKQRSLSGALDSGGLIHEGILVAKQFADAELSSSAGQENVYLQGKLL
ncbi:MULTISPECIES: hypothetical protein [Xanthomonas]|uniref:ATP-binding protein n=1 Tax=Xanthomonas dyei TaxID=743699 RepID=A0ABZ0D9V0_9XANT|nr:hypothetical protein [Xanthomonas dyei]WOB27044.1 hypothetical protein NYR99_03420 [Xanthomonas dyei]WOB54666.1 hypothetical protein NYR95_03425 [Xanthomonas dyei]